MAKEQTPSPSLDEMLVAQGRLRASKGNNALTPLVLDQPLLSLLQLHNEPGDAFHFLSSTCRAETRALKKKYRFPIKFVHAVDLFSFAYSFIFSTWSS